MSRGTDSPVRIIQTLRTDTLFLPVALPSIMETPSPFDIDRERLVDQLADLVRIDSTNPGLVPDGAGEAAVADYIAEAMREIGLEVEVWEPEPDRPNVVGVLSGTGGDRSLMFNAHTDTVGVEGMEDPFAPRIVDGRMYGRGTQDMKGSLAAQLAAVRALREADVELGGDVLVAAVIDEEHKSRGTEAVVLGPVGDGLHTTEEWVDLDSVVHLAEILARTAQRYCV